MTWPEESTRHERERLLLEARARIGPVVSADPEQTLKKRGMVAWYETLETILIGYYVLGFEYPMNGDDMP